MPNRIKVMDGRINLSSSNLTEAEIECIPVFESYFLISLQKMYDAENQIAIAFNQIKDSVTSPELQKVFDNHYSIHEKHLQRIDKIFKFLKVEAKGVSCDSVDAILKEGQSNIGNMSGNTVNVEVALMLTSQKLTHYKIGAYAGLAYLAIRLNYTDAATFLAISVQEEEEYADNKLRDVIEEFLSLIAKGKK